MPIPVVCACSARLKVADHLLDLDVRCPKCGTIQAAAAPPPDSPYYTLFSATPRTSRAAGPSPAEAPPATPEEVLARSPLSDAEKRRLEAELENDERLVWAGKPDPSLALRRTLMISGGLVVAAIFMFVIGGVFYYITTSAEGRDLGTFGVALLAIVGSLGGGLVIAAVVLPLFRRWHCRHSFYAVTTARAIVFELNPFLKLRAVTYTPGDLHAFHRRDLSSDGDAGDLVFKTRTFQFNSGDANRPNTTTIVLRYGFLNLRGAPAVEKIVRETLVDPLLDHINA